MRLSGYQPQYFPRLHYFNRMLDSDVFEFSDYVQFVKKHAYPMPDGSSKRGKSFQADTPIKLSSGLHFLTLPVRHDGLKPINETDVDEARPWRRDHLRSIESGYARARNFKIFFSEIEKLLLAPHPHLAALNIATTLWALGRILPGTSQEVISDLDEINARLADHHPFRLKKIVILSKTRIPPPREHADANDWIIAVCKTFGTNEYYCGGTSGHAYMDEARFAAAGIKTTTQSWICQPYRQQHPKAGFLPNLSIIDLLMNEGAERVCKILAASPVLESTHA